MTELREIEAMCRQFLRPGEDLRGPIDWTLRPGDLAFMVEAGYPEAGQAFNGFVDGWGPTPEAAWNALGWKLTERRVSGRIKWPKGPDHTPLYPTSGEVAKQDDHYRRSMSPMGYEYAKAFLWPPDLADSMGHHR